MPLEITLNRVPSEPNVQKGIVLDRRVREYATPTSVLEYWRWEDDTDMEPQFLTERTVGTQVRVPFDLGDRPIRIFTVAKTDKGVPTVAEVKRSAVQTVFPSAPTFTSATWNTGDEDIDLVFAKQGMGTGDIQVEYKKTTESVWQTHATDFAHNATSGTIAIAQETNNVDYDLRLKQVDIPGYSITRQVTVVGTGADTPPSDLSVVDTYLGSCEHQIDLSWTAGTGSGNYTVERKVGFGGTWSVVDTGVVGTTYMDTQFGTPYTSRTFVYRVKQEDVSGYSNEDAVTLGKCFEEL